MFSSAEMQLLYKVANAPIQMFPYPHILVHDVFPEEFYLALRQHLPPGNVYKTLKALGRVTGNYADARVVLPLTDPEVGALDEPYRSFWNDTKEWLLGGPFGQLMLKKFGPLLAQRFENLAALQYRHEALIVQDHTNYSLGPHTDSPSKILSFLFYLPADDTRPHLGTSMYVPNDASFTCPGGLHHKFEGFQRLLTMPYVKNTLFAFMKTSTAFHGVEPISESNVERALLLYDIRVANVPAVAAKPAVSPHTTFSF